MVHPGHVLAHRDVRGPASSKEKTLYQNDYDTAAVLTDIAKEHHSSIVSLMHTRKMPGESAWYEISGSTGLTGAVDGTLILRRQVDKSTKNGFLSLFVDGRDIPDPQEYALTKGEYGQLVFDGQAWKKLLTEKKRAICELLQHVPDGMTIEQIAERLGKNLHTTRIQVGQLRKNGTIERIGRNLYIPTGYSIQAELVDNEDDADVAEDDEEC